jgi:hypothetical protein
MKRLTIPPNVNLRKGRMADETVVLFHGRPIGTLKRHETRYPIRNDHKVRWYIHTFDDNHQVGWGSSRRAVAVSRLLHLFMDDTGSSSARLNSWVWRVKKRIEFGRPRGWWRKS